MKVTINNESKETSAANIAELAQELQLPERGVAIAVNNAIVVRADWADRSLNENDSITVIKAAFGG